VAKLRTVYLCQNCGHQSPKWGGQCPSCNAWNTLHEEVIAVESSKKKVQSAWKDENSESEPIKLEEITSVRRQKMVTKDTEFNRVLGGGIVPGSLILIGGHPGIGNELVKLKVNVLFMLKQIL